MHQLQDIYYAGKQLVKALPGMADKATGRQLKQGFLTHLDEKTPDAEKATDRKLTTLIESKVNIRAVFFGFRPGGGR